MPTSTTVPRRHYVTAKPAVQSSLWLSRSMCRDWPTSDMIMDMEREEALKDLKQFQENFKVRDHGAGYPRLFDLEF